MRKFILMALLGGTLAGCTAAQIESATTTVEADIQAGSAALCGVVPTLQTITSVVGVLFPGIASITAIAGAGETAVEQEVCSAVTTPAAQARLRASVPGMAVNIGVSAHQVMVQGWRAR